MKCRACSAELSLQMIDLGAAPPSNAFHATQDEPEQHYPLRVLVCQQCWLAQTDISLFKLDHDQLFTRDYPYFSSTSPGWVAHAKAYCAMVADRFQLGSDSLTVEVGSNDGYLLQHVGTPCCGFEPTATAKVAQAKGIRTVEKFFGAQEAEASLSQGGRADLMICNNALAHVPDINDFLRGFAVLLKRTGVATFEFPHLMRLIEGAQFDTVYHEHYSYLSFTAVQGIFAANGLHCFDVEELPTHGGSLRVYAQRVGGARETTIAVQRMRNREANAGMTSPSFYAGLQDRADCIKNDLMQFLLSIKAMGRTVAAFGAAAKGNTLLNYAGIRADLLPYVVDETPAKQGKFLPGSRIPVLDDFAGRPDYVLILPWNFKADIMAKLAYIREWGGKFVTAIPRLEVM